MKEKRFFRPLIGVLCVLLLAGATVLALYLDSQSPDPIFGIFRPTVLPEPFEELPDEIINSYNETITPPPDLPSSVEIPTDEDAELGISFPCQIPEYGLVIEKMAPYTGLYVEDGSNAHTESTAMLMVYNNGDFPVEYTQICVVYEEHSLLFDISGLPVGERVVVQEKSGKTIPDAQAINATALVVQRADMEMSENKVKVTDNGDNTLTVENLTDETIPTVRVFYKYYLEDEGIFVGGISFTLRITRLGAGAKVRVQPSHYTSQTSRLVMVLTYDSEV